MPEDPDYHEKHHRHVGRASFAHLFSNWDSYEASFGKKLALALRNATLGRARYGTCCGHYGEPGC